MAVKDFIDLSAPHLDKLLGQLELTTRELLQTIAAFSPEQFNQIPFEGSWTAGQVAEHLLKSESGIPEVVSGATKPTERAIDEKLGAIESIFLDFEIKMKSPDFIIPGNGPHNKEEILDAFTSVRDRMINMARTMDLSLTCTSFPFPEIGELTRWEWLGFAVCHSTRHIRQLKNIYQKVSG
jgi:DinB superfamily